MTKPDVGEIYASCPINKADRVTFTWEHSFEHVPWKEFYEVTDDGFLLHTIAVGGFGAGIPAEMDCTIRYADDPMKTGYASVKLALAGFIVPFMFVFNQKLLLIDTGLLDGIQVAATACIGVFLISVATEGYLFRKVCWLIRIVMFIGALLLISSSIVTNLIGLLICVSGVIYQKKFGSAEVRTCIISDVEAS